MTDSTESIEAAVDRFVAHKRAHGRKYHSEQAELRPLIRFAAEHGVTRLHDLTPARLNEFLGSAAELLHGLPNTGRLALRDRALLLFLYNTGARVQEVADLRVEHLDLSEHPTVRLHGKGDKWRTCPLWQQTALTLEQLLQSQSPPPTPQTAVFAARGQPLTRSGIYKIVRRHAGDLDDPRTGRRISPHTFRHTAAVHLLEAGVEVNVIRGWLGHADLTTTNRYAEINTKAKQQALLRTEPPGVSAGSRNNPIWQTDESLLNWLASL